MRTPIIVVAIVLAYVAIMIGSMKLDRVFYSPRSLSVDANGNLAKGVSGANNPTH